MTSTRTAHEGGRPRCSVGDAEVLAVMGGGLDLVDNRGREVGAGDVGAALGIEECDLAAHTVGPRALAGRPGAVRAGGADEDPVELLGSLVNEHDTGRLALQCLRAVLLWNLALNEAWRIWGGSQRAEPADLQVSRTGRCGQPGQLSVHLDQPASHVAARSPARDDRVCTGEHPLDPFLGSDRLTEMS
jgi:hypothetical protein